jgi:hypothetical protein
MSRYIPKTVPEVVHITRGFVYKDHFGKDKPSIRYANMEFHGPPLNVIYQLATLKGEIVLKETEVGRKNLRATFSETGRHVSSLDIHNYTGSTGKEV